MVILELLFRPHSSATHVDAACCYRLSSVICPSVTVVSRAKMVHLTEVPFGLKTRVAKGTMY